MRALLQTDNVSIQFHTSQSTVQAVRGVSFSLYEGETLAIVGESGCGKSVLCKSILRLLPHSGAISNGKLLFQGQDLTALSEKAMDRIRGREIAMVFQDPMTSLNPLKSIGKQIQETVELHQGLKGEAAKKKTLEILEDVGISEPERRYRQYPHEFSGGQRQRVGIARAYCNDPKVMLMDEPLSNLDAKLRNQMRAELIKLRERINTTFIYVTHDQTEAMTLGDRIVIMRDGEIQQVGTPQEVFDHPANLFVAGFIGMPRMNTFDAQLQRDPDGKYAVQLANAHVVLSDEKQARLAQKNVQPGPIVLGIRPEHIMLAGEGEQMIHGTVDVSEMMGSAVHLHLQACGRDTIIIVQTMSMQGATNSSFGIGQSIAFTFGGNVVHVFDPETGKNLEF